jgi:hypothetical protein
MDGTLTPQEIDLLMQALTNVDLKTKDAIAQEIRQQGRITVPADPEKVRSLLEKLGYKDLGASRKAVATSGAPTEEQERLAQLMAKAVDRERSGGQKKDVPTAADRGYQKIADAQAKRAAELFAPPKPKPKPKK